MSRRVRLAAIAAVSAVAFAPGVAMAGNGRTGPTRSSKPLCSQHRVRHCIPTPRNVVRPKHHKQQGGPNLLVPAAPTDGGLGGPGFNPQESAIAWALSLRGNTSYAWWCERFV